jgi:hypothetical protein
MSHDDVRRAFVNTAAGKLSLERLGLTYAPDGQIINLTGWHSDGTPFAFISAPFMDEPDDRAREIALDLITAHTGKPPTIAQRIKHMGKLQEVAARMRETKVKLDAEADKLAARLDELDTKAPKAFDHGHQFLDMQHKDVDGLEEGLRQLTNLPLGFET